VKIGNLFRKIIWLFIIFTGTAAGVSILFMDNVVPSLANPKLITVDKIKIPDDLTLESVTMSTKDINIDGRYLDVDNADFVVLICRDWKGNLYQNMEVYRLFRDLGISLLVFDYRGFGLSRGEEFNEKGFIDDATRAYRKLRQKKWQPNEIILYGEGFGSTVAAEIANTQSCAGLIAENTVPSLNEITPGRLKKFLIKHRLSFKKKLMTISQPVCVIHGSENPLVSASIVENMLEEIKTPTQFSVVSQTGPGSVYLTNPEEWKINVKKFVTILDKPEKEDNQPSKRKRKKVVHTGKSKMNEEAGTLKE